MASEIPIKRKDLWESRGNIKFDEITRAATKLGLPLTSPGSTSHIAIRKKGTDTSKPLGLDSFVVNVYEKMSKQAIGDVIKCIISKAGIQEDELWRALGRLK